MEGSLLLFNVKQFIMEECLLMFFSCVFVEIMFFCVITIRVPFLSFKNFLPDFIKNISNCLFFYCTSPLRLQEELGVLITSHQRFWHDDNMARRATFGVLEWCFMFCSRDDYRSTDRGEDYKKLLLVDVFRYVDKLRFKRRFPVVTNMNPFQSLSPAFSYCLCFSALVIYSLADKNKVPVLISIERLTPEALKLYPDDVFNPEINFHQILPRWFLISF